MSTVYTIDPYISGVHHRGEFDSLYCYVDNLVGHINDIACIVVQYHNGTWWITPSYISDEELMADFGPYDTMDDAIIFLKLLSTTVSHDE